MDSRERIAWLVENDERDGAGTWHEVDRLYGAACSVLSGADLPLTTDDGEDLAYLLIATARGEGIGLWELPDEHPANVNRNNLVAGLRAVLCDPGESAFWAVRP